MRLLGSWLAVQRLRRRAVATANAAWQATLGQLAGKLQVSRPVKLLESALVEVPTVIGWLRPVILLPAAAITGLTTEQLESLLAHELAHVRRHDYLINLLQTLIETLLLYHPAVWWVSHCIREEREHCCDDLAIRVCGNRLEYAKALVAMEELRGPHLSLAMSAGGGSLLSRVARLIGVPAQPEFRSGWCGGLALLTALGVAWVLCSAEEPDPDDREYSFKLDNGVTIRLLAIRDFSMDDNTSWWRPNGSPLKEALPSQPIFGKGSRPFPGREFALEIDGLSAEQQSLQLVNDNGASGNIVISSEPSRRRSFRLHSTLKPFDGYFPVSTRRAGVQIRLTDGPWGPWQRISPDGTRDLSDLPNELRSLYEEIRLQQLHDTGQVDLRWTPRLDVRAILDVRVVDVDDVVHRERASSSGQWDGSQMGFTVPRDRVKWVEYRLWPYSREVRFENVSVRAEHRTKVAISEKGLCGKWPTSETSPPSTLCFATWSAQFDQKLQADLLTASDSRKVHDVAAGEVFVVNADRLKEQIRRLLLPDNRQFRLLGPLNWNRNPDEIGNRSWTSGAYFHERTDFGLSEWGSGSLHGHFAVVSGDAGIRLSLNGNWDVEPKGDARKSLGAAFAADAGDGEAIVLVMPLANGGSALQVWEPVRVPLSHWRELSTARDSRDWLNTSLASYMAAIDRSREWVRDVPSSPIKAEPKWTQTLTDGKQVSLLGVSNLARWPFVWWMADGSPLRFGHGHLSNRRPVDDRLVGLIHILASDANDADRDINLEALGNTALHFASFHDRQPHLFENIPGINGTSHRYLMIPDLSALSTVPAEPELAISVPVGEWIAVGQVTADKPLVKPEGRYEVKFDQRQQSNSILVYLTHPTSEDRQVSLVAVTTEGKRIRPRDELEAHVTARQNPVFKKHPSHAHFQFQLKRDRIAHFDVESRPTQTARFVGFATEPKGLESNLESTALKLPNPPITDTAKAQDTRTDRTEPNIKTLQPNKITPSSDVELRFAKASADVVKAEYDKLTEANQKVPGAIPTAEIDRLRRVYLRAVLKVEQLENAQRMREWEQAGRPKEREEELIRRSRELRTEQATFDADDAKQEYEYEKLLKATEKTPGSVREAEIQNARTKWDEAQLTEKEAKLETCQPLPNADRVAAALRDLTSAPFSDTPLSEVVTYLSEYHNIPAVLSRSARRFAEFQVTLSASNVDLADALMMALHPKPLSYCIDEGRLLIAPPEEIQQLGHKSAPRFEELLAELNEADATIPWEQLLRRPMIGDLKVRAKEDIPKLNVLLTHRNDVVQRAAVRCFAAFGELAPFRNLPAPNRAFVERLTKANDWRIARAAWQTLEMIGHEDFSTLPLMLTELENGREEFGREWPHLLMQFDQKKWGRVIWNELVEAYPKLSPRARFTMAASTNKFQDQAFPLVILVISDSEKSVRRSVLHSNKYRNVEGQWEAALKVCLRDSEPEIRMLAAEPLLGLLGIRDTATEALEQILTELEQADPERKNQAMRVLAPRQSVIDALDQVSRSGNKSRSWTARRTLAYLGQFLIRHPSDEAPWGASRNEL